MSSNEPLTFVQRLLAYLFAPWHLRRMPGTGPEARRRRGVWCRDHCGTFAGRWFVLGAVAWLLQSPLGSLSIVGGVPVLALLFFLGFAMGIFHLILQIAAQGRVGPPPIDPPVDPGRRDRD